MVPFFDTCDEPRQTPLGKVSLAVNPPLQKGDVTLPTSGSFVTFESAAWIDASWDFTEPPEE
jgi:hypothetical protein